MNGCMSLEQEASLTRETKIKNAALEIIRDRVSSEGLQRFICQGHCMSPLLQDESLVFVKAVSSRELGLGDIIVLKKDDRYFCHRFLYKTTGPGGAVHFRTKADNYFQEDPLTPGDRFAGKIVALKTKSRTLNLEKRSVKTAAFLLGAFSFAEAVIYRLEPGRLVTRAFRRLNRTFIRPVKSSLVQLSLQL